MLKLLICIFIFFLDEYELKNKNLIAFGPVPSRRLGHSLGINNIPPKICSYSCIYCQLGKTKNMKFQRSTFYKVEDIIQAVKNQLEKTKGRGESVDYLTFVPDGEPTLDINLGHEIELLKPLGIKIAVITNSSLIWNPDVRNNLQKADLVSLKIDAASKEIWKRMNRPHKNIKLNEILDGLIRFAKTFKNKLITETMLIQNINDNISELNKIANLIEQINPDECFISIPIRPPAEKWAIPANEESINNAFQIFNKKCNRVEYLIGYEGNEFAFTGNIENDLLSITSVHPMREEGVKELLKRANTNWSIINRLLDEKKLTELKFQGKKFYMRRLSSISSSN